MRRILFVLPSFRIGGTTVSTLNLINLLKERGWECSVLPLQEKGELFDLYTSIEKVPTPLLLSYISAPSYKMPRTYVGKIAAAIVRFLTNHFESCFRFIMSIVYHKINGGDYSVIAATQELLASKVVAYFPHPLKVAWVRCDYSSYLHRSGETRDHFYSHFHSIVCVSNQGAQSFMSVFPDLKKKVFCIPNPQDSRYIKERADAEEHDVRFNQDCFTIVSVGRMDPVKRYVEIPYIARLLLDKGIDFKWYIIGDGAEKQKITEQIEKWGVTDNVILLGVKTNPHYYIKKSDLYVCLSSTESCPRVVNEAKILGTPTVSTDFPSIYEFLEDKKTGWIGDLESIPNLIEQAVNNKDLYQEIVHNIESFEFDNTQLILCIEQLFTAHE